MIDRDSPNVVQVLQAWQTLVDYGFQDKSFDAYASETLLPSRGRQRQPVAMPGGRSRGEPVPPLPHGMLKVRNYGLLLFSSAIQAIIAKEGQV